MYSEELIQEATRRLVAAYAPEKIYLFGSYAWGTPSEDSDLDFMIVLDHPGPIPHAEFVKGHEALIGLGCSKDIMVNSKAYFERGAASPVTIQAKISRNGRLLYERA